MFGNEKLITFLVVVVIMKVSADEGDGGLECCVCIQSWGGIYGGMPPPDGYR